MPRRSTLIRYVQRDARTYATVHEVLRSAPVSPVPPPAGGALAVNKLSDFVLRMRLDMSDARLLRPRFFIVDGDSTFHPIEVKRRVKPDGTELIFRVEFEGLPNTTGSARQVELWICATTRIRHAMNLSDKTIATWRPLTINA